MYLIIEVNHGFSGSMYFDINVIVVSISRIGKGRVYGL